MAGKSRFLTGLDARFGMTNESRFPSAVLRAGSFSKRSREVAPDHCIELATLENTLFAFDPINWIVPTTRTRITASITAYSAMSCPSS